MRSRLAARARAWLVRWRPVLPLLIAEFIIVVGFGALLPVLPLYVVDQGVDPATLGIILAAWPAARLVFEPFFGWLADRTSRRPLMVAGLVVLAVASLLPLAFHGPLELLLLRFLSGAAASMYDPAARGILVDATEEDERGEVFGLYTSAQMGGLIFGPVVGAFGAALGGGFAFPFLAAGVATAIAAVYLAIAALPTTGGRHEHPPLTETSYAEYGTDSADLAQRYVESQRRDRRPQAPLRELWNRAVVGALTMNFALYLAVGVYEVVWSLYMQHLGAPLAWIGITYVLFALPVVLLSPFAGRLVDRLGGLRFAFGGGFVVGVALFVYALASEPYLPGAVILIEATANAFLGPAMFAILAQGTPAGRSSTTQGIFGAAGTIAFIVASLLTGVLFAIDARYPFAFFGGIVLAFFLIGGLIARGPARGRTVRQGDRLKAYRPLPVARRRAALGTAIEAYERGDAFLAHELLEPAWMGTADEAERDLYQGLIKLAAAEVHAVRGNATGVAKNLRGALAHLARADAGGIDGGLDLPALRRSIEDRLAALEAGDRAAGRPLSASTLPRRAGRHGR